MKLALISPRGNFMGNDPELRAFWEQNAATFGYRDYFPGLGIGLLVVAALTPPQYEIELIDENSETIDFTKEYDIVGITCFTQQVVRCYEIADAFRRNGTTVVIGGIHATLMPDEAQRHADSIVVGEAENVWAQLLNDFESRKLKARYQSERMANLRSMPSPRYDLACAKGYSVFWVQTTRGCPHDCDFCAASNVYGRRYRSKSPDQVIGEIELIKRSGAQFKIYFADDNFFVQKEVYSPVMRYLAHERISWIAQTDISIAEKEHVLSHLFDSGCRLVFIGFESLAENALLDLDRQNWKLRKLSFYPEYVKRIQSFGVGVRAAFIFGLDCDDSSSFDRVVAFVQDNMVFGLQATILTPYPGTRLREKLLSEGRLLSKPWDNYTGFDINYKPQGMNAETLQRGLLHVYRSTATKEFTDARYRHFKEIYKSIMKKSAHPRIENNTPTSLEL